jgi:hypothetical protein
MIDLLIQVFYVFAVLAVISLFVCTLPVWVFRRLQSREMVLVYKELNSFSAG